MTTVSSAEHTRRDFLYIATGAVGAVGAAAVLVPLIAQMNPDASTIAAGAPVEIDLAPIADGQIVKVFWRSKPIFIFHRTKHDIELAQNVECREPARPGARFRARQAGPRAVAGRHRHLHPSRLHPARRTKATMTAGSAPATARNTTAPAASGKGPAPKNLYLPPYTFVSDTKIRIGEIRQPA